MIINNYSFSCVRLFKQLLAVFLIEVKNVQQVLNHLQNTCSRYVEKDPMFVS